MSLNVWYICDHYMVSEEWKIDICRSREYTVINNFNSQHNETASDETRSKQYVYASE